MVKIIKNGRVIDPESRFDGRADLWIENGKIQKIVKKDTKSESDEASDAPFIPADAEVLDAEGLQTMRNIGKNMAWMLQCIACAKQHNIPQPQPDVADSTNFIH